MASQASGGETSGSLPEISVHVCFLGMRFVSLKAGLVKTMLASTCWEAACPASTGSGVGAASPEAWSEAAAAGAVSGSPSSLLEQPAATRVTSRAVGTRASNNRVPLMV